VDNPDCVLYSALEVRMRTLVVAPALNERGKISRVAAGVLRQRASIPDLQLLVVDDGSTDGTADEARQAGCLVLSHPQNMGVGAAIRSGIHYAREHGFDVVCVISGDDQHDSDELPSVVGPVARGEVDLIQGSRYLPGGKIENAQRFRGLMIPIGSAFVRALFGFKITDLTNGLRAFRVKLIDELGIDLNPSWLNSYELEPYLLLQLIRRGARWRETPVTVRYHRAESFSKMKPFRDWWRLMRPVFALRLGLWS
jgi:dolichol-phosphate mannosyltransferase